VRLDSKGSKVIVKALGSVSINAPAMFC